MQGRHESKVQRREVKFERSGIGRSSETAASRRQEVKAGSFQRDVIVAAEARSLDGEEMRTRIAETGRE